MSMQTKEHRGTHIANQEEEPRQEPGCRQVAEYMCGDCGRYFCEDDLELLEEGRCAPCGLDVCPLEERCNREQTCGDRRPEARRRRNLERRAERRVNAE